MSTSVPPAGAGRQASLPLPEESAETVVVNKITQALEVGDEALEYLVGLPGLEQDFEKSLKALLEAQSLLVQAVYVMENFVCSPPKPAKVEMPSMKCDHNWLDGFCDLCGAVKGGA